MKQKDPKIEPFSSKNEYQFSEIEQAILKQLILGASKEKIVRILVKNKISKEVAEKSVDELDKVADEYMKTPQGKLIIKAQAKAKMIQGGGMCIFGIIITFITYSIASSNSGGGTYVIAGGAVLFGFIDFVIGLIEYLTA